MRKKYITFESVTEGHPDKLCDYISDSLLDSYLEKDINSKVAIEAVASKDKIFVCGQVTSNASVNIEKIIRNTIKEIGYGDENLDINPDTCQVEINVTKQSQELECEIESGLAGDQGIMIGYATNETASYMPLGIDLAHKLSKRLAEVRKTGILNYLRPDGKVQVTIEYIDEIPNRVESVLVSTQHNKNILKENLKEDILEKVIKKVIPSKYIDTETKIIINPSNSFITGGPLSDAGLTGRKIIADTYGPIVCHGGGAFSGKDATKLDRSAAYMMRHIAKNIVANNHADKCLVQVAYAIGREKPVSIHIDTFGTNKIDEDKILEKINKKFDLSPNKIIDYLGLKNPIYRYTTNYGHFGKENLSWEKIIKM